MNEELIARLSAILLPYLDYGGGDDSIIKQDAQDAVRECLAEIEAAGMAVVPREPSEAMLAAGMTEEGTDLASEYRAMISASRKG